MKRRDVKRADALHRATEYQKLTLAEKIQKAELAPGECKKELKKLHRLVR